MKLISPTELADILEVTKSTISRAIKSGRISKAVISRSKTCIELDLVTAILEFHNNADLSKNRGDFVSPTSKELQDGNETILETNESQQIRSHYAAANEKLEFLTLAKKLISADAVQLDVFNMARTTRDRVLDSPHESSLHLKKSLVTFLVENVGTEFVAEKRPELDILVQSFRKTLKSDLTNCLLSLSNEMGDGKWKKTYS